MALTSIGDQKTPGRPIEITFGAELGLPSANQELILVGRGGADVPAVAQVETITCPADTLGSLDGAGVLLHDNAGSVAFWIDIDDSGTTIPAWAAAADRAVEITSIVTDDIADDVAAALQAAIDGDSAFSATNSGADVEATQAVAGDRTDGSAGAGAFTFVVDTDGVDAVTVGSATDYELVVIANVADAAAAKTETDPLFGAGSELQNMILAAIRANAGGSTFPTIKAIPLAPTDTDFGASDEALTEAKKFKGEFLVSPFTGMDVALRAKLIAAALEMSGAQRVENDQYGTVGVAAELATSIAGLDKPDTEFFSGVYMRDTGTNPYTPAELAAAYAAKLAQNGAPFNPLDDVDLENVSAPATRGDYLTIGAGLESEAVLAQGWTPLKVKPNGKVAIVRSVTSRLTIDGAGVTDVTAYYDVQDFQVLYFWRKTLFSRFSQTDFKRRKASISTAQEVRSEMIRLAQLFEDQEMFQAVSQLAKQFQVERSLSDRHRFDYKTPVNVIPGLHVIAGNIEAGTQFDTLSI